MAIPLKTLLLVCLNPTLKCDKQTLDVCASSLSCKKPSFTFSHQINLSTREYRRRDNLRPVCPVCAVLSAEEVGSGVSSAKFEDFSVITTNINETGELKISVEVSGARTRAIFNNVFVKMVAAAQPIPGFRRVKGGKTPNIPRDTLLVVLGPSKVYKAVIQKVINSTIAEYVKKEKLKVTKDLRIEQSYEDLEDLFEPDEKLRFDAVIMLHETNRMLHKHGEVVLVSALLMWQLLTIYFIPD